MGIFSGKTNKSKAKIKEAKQKLEKADKKKRFSHQIARILSVYENALEKEEISMANRCDSLYYDTIIKMENNIDEMAAFLASYTTSGEVSYAPLTDLQRANEELSKEISAAVAKTRQEMNDIMEEEMKKL